MENCSTTVYAKFLQVGLKSTFTGILPRQKLGVVSLPDGIVILVITVNP